ncbi:MAG: NYN domain-containing protein [Pseudanabaenaceae cyanobacterium]|jgi:hypothetical protein
MAPHYPPLMLVDGYNVIGLWHSLQSVRDTLGFEAAREQLIETVYNYSAFRGYRTTLVFDAYIQPTPSRLEKLSPNLSLYFTEFRETADTYIEKTCGQYYRDPMRHVKRLIVVTSDRAQQLTSVGFGAEWMSAQLFEAEVNQSLTAVRQRLKQKTTNHRRTIGNRIDPKTRDQLSQWRNRLG